MDDLMGRVESARRSNYALAHRVLLGVCLVLVALGAVLCVLMRPEVRIVGWSLVAAIVAAVYLHERGRRL